MTQIFSRRLFLAATGAALAAPRVLWAKEPAGLDHIILGMNDLDRGIAFVEEKTGVRAAFGGVHPGRGTQNALVSLGEQRYLEIIAPDPKQNVPPQIPGLRELQEPRLFGWAVHTTDIAALAKKVREAGVAIAEPRDGRACAPTAKLCAGNRSRSKTTAAACSRSSSSGAAIRSIPPPTRRPAATSGTSLSDPLIRPSWAGPCGHWA